MNINQPDDEESLIEYESEPEELFCEEDFAIENPPKEQDFRLEDDLETDPFEEDPFDSGSQEEEVRCQPDLDSGEFIGKEDEENGPFVSDLSVPLETHQKEAIAKGKPVSKMSLQAENVIRSADAQWQTSRKLRGMIGYLGGLQ